MCTFHHCGLWEGHDIHAEVLSGSLMVFMAMFYQCAGLIRIYNSFKVFQASIKGCSCRLPNLVVWQEVAIWVQICPRPKSCIEQTPFKSEKNRSQFSSLLLFDALFGLKFWYNDIGLIYIYLNFSRVIHLGQSLSLRYISNHYYFWSLYNKVVCGKKIWGTKNQKTYDK